MAARETSSSVETEMEVMRSFEVARGATEDEEVQLGGQGNRYAFIQIDSEWVKYDTPDGAEYIAICLPAFAPDTVHRDE